MKTPNHAMIHGASRPSAGRPEARHSANTWSLDVGPNGEFVRQPTEFRQWVRRSDDADFRAEANRYHLYVSYACPWAHRTLILRALKGLEHAVGVSVVHPLLDARGWHFDDAFDDPPTRDDLHGASTLRELYDRSVEGASYAGRITVPVLWDEHTGRIVNNESSELIRMLNAEFNDFAERPSLDLYPEPRRAEIEDLNGWIYESINNGVYRCGFARTQAAYERAYHQLFRGLDRVEGILSRRRYLTGNALTEADVRLFTTLVRFDPVYHNHFRCNERKLQQYPNLWGYVLDVAQLGGVMDTIRMDHIKLHYYASHTSINPTQIVPLGPRLDLNAPHDRARLAGLARGAH